MLKNDIKKNKFICNDFKVKNLHSIYKILFRNFGPQKWWPAKSRFEIIVGAVLTQNTAWSNVEKAIKNLKKNGLLNLKALSISPLSKLYAPLRPSGYFRLKSKRLKETIDFFNRNGNSDLNRFFKRPLTHVREELLAVKGIGPETADSILLYAGNMPVFVVDAYTRRIFERLGIVKPDMDYHCIQKLFMKNLPKNTKLYNEYHALIVLMGKEICRIHPRCNICPLNNHTDKLKTENAKRKAIS